jgi:hypothetical protein
MKEARPSIFSGNLNLNFKILQHNATANGDNFLRHSRLITLAGNFQSCVEIQRKQFTFISDGGVIEKPFQVRERRNKISGAAGDDGG